MICVLPTHRGDTARLKDLLLWMQQLGGCHGHSALIVADAGTPYREVLDIRTAAAKVFTTNDLTVNDRPTSGWIEGPKSLFFEAARWCYEKTIGPWLWLETDAIPLRPQWLDALQAEYAAKGKAVMGCVYRSTAAEFPDPLMSGVAVFSWDAYQNLKRGDRNFDLDFQDYAMVNGANTTLIQHLWGGKNMPPTFVSVKSNPVLVNIFTLADLWPTAVLFHRNKDGTLIELLRARMGLNAPRNGHKVFCHGGDLGDLIHSLCAVQAAGGGHLVLIPHQVREAFNYAKANTVLPLLQQQPYLRDPIFRDGPMRPYPPTKDNLPMPVDYDLDMYRPMTFGMRGQRTWINIAQGYLKLLGLDTGLANGDRPWIYLDEATEIPGFPVVFSRSPRYHNRSFPWRRVFGKYGRQAVFVGTQNERDVFSAEFGPVRHFPTATLLDLAKVIAGCRLFIGNQSCPFAIAEGLKQNAILEFCTQVPDCNFRRENLMVVRGEDCVLPEIP
jgi:hypothetical protein